jgi:D-inositol-3-phosphate glycosyltransferase
LNVERVACITFHACPLAAPGQGKSGGMNVYVRQLASALGVLGIGVDVFTRAHPDCDHPVVNISPNVRVVHLPGGGPEVPMEDLFSYLPGFLEALREFQRDNHLDYQAVHSHYWLSGWVGQEVARGLEIPHIVTFHTLALIKMQSRAGEREPLQRQRVEREVMASSDQIIAFSPHERDAMQRLYDADPSKIELVPCGVDLETFRPLGQELAREKLGINGDKVLLYVGRLESLKGIDLLVNTAAQMETCHGLRVLVVGGDNGKEEELERLRRLTQELNVEDKFDFVGRVDQEDLPVYYSAADVCVVPSFYESFGLAALEAMACGTPVVASRVGGLSTVIQHGRTGYLKSWRCPEAFAHSLEMIISSKRLQDSMGLAARRCAEGMGWEQVAERMVNLYESLSAKVSL